MSETTFIISLIAVIVMIVVVEIAASRRREAALACTTKWRITTTKHYRTGDHVIETYHYTPEGVLRAVQIYKENADAIVVEMKEANSDVWSVTMTWPRSS